MRFNFVNFLRTVSLAAFFSSFQLNAQAQVVATNTTIRVMAANLNGSVQSYQPFALRIFQGLKPDIVAIQEFNYSNNTPSDFRSMLNTAFGTNFVYSRETNAYSIPNGIISRYPIIASGEWIDSDPNLNDRGFAWARIDLPGTNDLYVVSIHLKASSGTSNVDRRTAEANEISSLIASNFPTNAWIVVAGDMNLYDESEGAIIKFKTYLSDTPVPADQSGGTNTNLGRNERYDRVLPNFSFNTNRVASVIGSQTLTNGLVFDSRIYNPLSEVAPIQLFDSTNAQHMAVLKDFRINYTITNFVTVPPPVLTLTSTNIIRWQGISNVTYSVQASTNLPAFFIVGSAISTTTNLAFTNQNSSAPQQFFRVVYP